MKRVAEGGPLTGYRVLELTNTVAGPFCGRVLADFGAEVIKIEPAGGDDLRTFGKRINGKSLYAGSILRNKALISIDLKSPEGQKIVGKIASQCDLLVENFRPGTLEKWNLSYQTLAEDNAQLVMVRISGWGQTGPYSQRPGYGVIAEALSGLRHLTGEPDNPPPRIAVSLTDYIAGVYAAFGAVMALHQAQRTGKGQIVDTALYEGAFSMMEPYVPSYEKLGLVQMPTGSRLPNSTPNNLYFTKDGKYLLIAAHSQSLFQKLIKVMGKEEIINDERFKTAEQRYQHEDELDAIITDWTKTYSLIELEIILHESGIPASRIYTIADIFQDPHYQAREMLTEVPDEDLGQLTMPGITPKLSSTPGQVRWSGRYAGEDTRQVLTELAGLSATELDRLQAEGVIYSHQKKQEFSE